MISENNISTTILQLFGTLSYNFKTNGNNVYPFIEGQIGYISESASGTMFNSSSSGLGWGFRGGIKVVVAPHLLLTFSAQYNSLTLNESNSNQRNGLNFFSLGVGVGGFF